ncbi:hypothetical protein NP493_115g01018 [Ridgeia piscesae]|uniref:Uncharacterized protein n=1 Tax=Ridgeia piscesae TaxID=27915 RepID=A0AAD9P6G1_RIDPI|nr:hypothetical protein NP493_115g01018 [Ridgeia piscesae]
MDSALAHWEEKESSTPDKEWAALQQKLTRALKSVWWERKAVELQRAADRNDMKGFYNGLKELRGPKKKGPVHLKSTDGMETFSDSESCGKME